MSKFNMLINQVFKVVGVLMAITSVIYLFLS